VSERHTQFGSLSPEDIANAPGAEVDPDNHADIAEEFAEEIGVDPSPQQVDAYLALQEDDESLADSDAASRD
jgi:hypothetical protein